MVLAALVKAAAGASRVVGHPSLEWAASSPLRQMFLVAGICKLPSGKLCTAVALPGGHPSTKDLISMLKHLRMSNLEKRTLEWTLISFLRYLKGFSEEMRADLVGLGLGSTKE